MPLFKAHFLIFKLIMLQIYNKGTIIPKKGLFFFNSSTPYIITSNLNQTKLKFIAKIILHLSYL